MMYKILLLLLPALMFGQNLSEKPKTVFQKDTLLYIAKNKAKGFQHDYILFIPKGTKTNKRLYLLVEPNNTGRVSDSIEVHKKSAAHLASVSSVGNNISTELRIPLLVPVFPRPQSKELTYTHALDRDVMLEKNSDLNRIDLQLIKMIEDAKQKLKHLEIVVEDKVFMNGFSASGTFTNRFLFMHPELIKAAAMGGLNGELMLPLKEIKNKTLNYPLGINDFSKIAKGKFEREKYEQIPQFIYMGALDDNDAVQFDDAYSPQEREIINSMLGKTVSERWKYCQEIYNAEKLNVQFKTYADVGHWTTSQVNLEVILFFNKFLK